ncbi:cellulose-binding protein [Streptomyces sp. NPDC127108]|uniref:cellulose-binding protein n=1 Tax=Streptomyces sp. NPDC127108 TaxID=3345361 RepID=UPI00363F570B
MSGSGVSVSPHGFVAVRGRGYRPGQVEVYADALSQDRDAAWERAARLTVLAKDMGAEAARMREVVARLAPQTYEALGQRAQYLLALTVEEAAAVRDAAAAAARATAEATAAGAAALAGAARAYADSVCGEAEERARRRLLADGATADEVRVAARTDVKQWRGEALAALRDMRQRTSGLLADLEKEHAERWEAAEREIAEREAEAEAHEASLVAAAEARLAEAERARAQADEAARHGQEDAEARAADVLARARMREERLGRETERVLREHGERWDEVRAHMDHVRSSLSALTGRGAQEDVPRPGDPGTVPGPTSGTDS